MRQATVEKVRVPATHHTTIHVAMVSGRRGGRVIHHHREGIEGGVEGDASYGKERGRRREQEEVMMVWED